MKELIDKVSNFLNQHHLNVISISQGSKKLSKSTAPRNAFKTEDINQIFGGFENFFKELPKQGFTDGTTLALRRLYENGGTGSYHNIETITLNFSKQEENQETMIPITEQQPSPPIYQPPMPVASAMGFVQVTQNELVRNEVIRERFEDLKKENAKLDEELKDAKSEIRQLKDENFSLRLKLDTSEEKHQVDLKRQELDKKGFWESEAGSNIVGALGQVLPMVAERMMQSPTTGMVPALAMPNVSEIKQEFINIISDPNVTDEQVTHWYNLIFAGNG
ncbi:hypothetical protein ACI76O_05400 [Capnocytophaga cynodegmi]|uniref:hypothetical protein n=1 Tax=Capnocytophaga cynodegmi TaxID=28189 RepID=UPI003859EC72